MATAASLWGRGPFSSLTVQSQSLLAYLRECPFPAQGPPSHLPTVIPCLPQIPALAGNDQRNLPPAPQCCGVAGIHLSACLTLLGATHKFLIAFL